MRIEKQGQLEKLEGYAGLGMRDDAKILALKLLEVRDLSAPEFVRIVNAVTDMSPLPFTSTLKQWTLPVESCFSRLSPSAQREVQQTMFFFYKSLGDYRKAEAFLRPKFSQSYAMEAAMEVLLELGRLTDAKRMAERCKRALKRANSGERNFLNYALVRYYARVGDWTRAVKYLSELRLDKPYGLHGLVVLAELKVADAIKTVRNGLATLPLTGSNRRHLSDRKRSRPKVSDRMQRRLKSKRKRDNCRLTNKRKRDNCRLTNKRKRNRNSDTPRSNLKQSNEPKVWFSTMGSGLHQRKTPVDKKPNASRH